MRGPHSCIQVYMLCGYGCPMRRLDVGMTPITLLNEGVTLLKEGGEYASYNVHFYGAGRGGMQGAERGAAQGRGRTHSVCVSIYYEYRKLNI